MNYVGTTFLSLFLLAFLGVAGHETGFFKRFQHGLKNPHYVGNWTPANEWPAIMRDPTQQKSNRGVVRLEDGTTLTPKASYDITARVVSVYQYTTDATSPWSPLDFAVTWGPIASIDESKSLGTTQSGRYYHWSLGRNSTQSVQTISRHSANIHLIPATPEIAERLNNIRAGEIVTMKGHLVNLRAPNGIRWNTSLSRTDTGGGACEILYVEYVEASLST